MNQVNFKKTAIVLSALLFVAVLALVFVLYSFEGSGDESDIPEPISSEEEVEVVDARPKAKSFTMMVYVVGSDLESHAAVCCGPGATLAFDGGRIRGTCATAASVEYGGT